MHHVLVSYLEVTTASAFLRHCAGPRFRKDRETGV